MPILNRRLHKIRDTLGWVDGAWSVNHRHLWSNTRRQQQYDVIRGKTRSFRHESLIRSNATIRTRIAGSFQCSVWMSHQRAGMPHRFIKRQQHIDLVPTGDQRIHHRLREPLFEFQGIGALPPGAPEQPARCSHRRLQWLAEYHMPGEDCGLRLRLTVAAHRAIHLGAAILETRCGWIQCVKWFLARPQCQQFFRIQAERCAAILPVTAGGSG